MSNGRSAVPFSATLQVGQNLLSGLGSVRSLSVHILAEAYLVSAYEPDSFWAELKRLSIDPIHYLESDYNRFADDYQATVLYSKLPAKDTSDAQRLNAAALDNFRACEERNSAYNSSFSIETKFAAYKQLDKLGVPIELIRHKLSMILGKAPSLQYLANEGEWTEGASVSLNKRHASAFVKTYRGTTCTVGLAKLLHQEGVILPDVITSKPWKLVMGNLVSTVSKNLVTDRTIAAEPDINLFFQRAVGKKIARRLRRFGIDLRDQTNNQLACFLAYRLGLATVDLKDASNSNVLLPILAILDFEWGELITALRSPYGTFSSRKDVLSNKAEWFEYNMLSSMGNGFTFELETAVFFAIALACGCDIGETWVYGDDIIIPQTRVPLVSSVLSVFGHSVNAEKSFTEGTFFESCGVYTFTGIDVTPLKIKDYLNAPKDTIVLANKLRLYAHSRRFANGCDKRILPAWQMCIRWLPTHIRKHCRGPVNSGLCLYVNPGERIVLNTRSGKASGLIASSQLVPKMKPIGESYHNNLMMWSLRYVNNGSRRYSPSSLRYVATFDPIAPFAQRNVVKQSQVGWEVACMKVSSWYDMGFWW